MGSIGFILQLKGSLVAKSKRTLFNIILVIVLFNGMITPFSDHSDTHRFSAYVWMSCNTNVSVIVQQLCWHLNTISAQSICTVCLSIILRIHWQPFYKGRVITTGSITLVWWSRRVCEKSFETSSRKNWHSARRFGLTITHNTLHVKSEKMKSVLWRVQRSEGFENWCWASTTSVWHVKCSTLTNSSIKNQHSTVC